MKKRKYKKWYHYIFSTVLNASLTMSVKAVDFESGKKEIIKQYPDAYDIR